LTGAGLPATKLFYDVYGECMCPGTQLTFSQMREMFFRSAKSRTCVSNYPRLARILFGPCSAIASSGLEDAEIETMVRGAFEEIESERT
jgi:hypothetical protein